MLGGHLPELLIVLVLALVVFGPKRLPDIGESLGKSIRGFKHGVSDEETADRETQLIRDRAVPETDEVGHPSPTSRDREAG